MHGLTLPVWVTAAACAAVKLLWEKPFSPFEEIRLPNKKNSINVPVSSAALLESKDCSLGITFCNPGSCLDLTQGLEIWACIEYEIDDSLNSPISQGFESDLWLKIVPGYGVGKIKTNHEICLSSYARELLVLNLKPYRKPGKILKLQITFPAGKNLAARTSNEAFGVVDGLALIGMQAEVQTSASPKQLKNTILDLKEKCQNPHFDGGLIFVLGENGFNLALNHSLKRDSLIKTGNWLGPLIVAAAEAGVKQLLLWGYHGKLIKLAGGIFHTHHHLADARLEVLISIAVKESIPLQLIEMFSEASSVESAFLMLNAENPQLARKLWFRLAEEIEKRSSQYLMRYFSSAMEIGTVLFDRKRKLRWAGPIGIKRINSLDVTLEA